jgi:hypothetical protein
MTPLTYIVTVTWDNQSLANDMQETAYIPNRPTRHMRDEQRYIAASGFRGAKVEQVALLDNKATVCHVRL